MADETNYQSQFSGEINSKIRDLEEKQRVLKDRILLIGQNLIEIKENTNEKILEIKKELEMIKESINRTKVFLESISKEFSKFARKDDLEILAKQAKMFQPLEYIKQSKKNL
jgi:archaellum component FlaC